MCKHSSLDLDADQYKRKFFEKKIQFVLELGKGIIFSEQGDSYSCSAINKQNLLVLLGTLRTSVNEIEIEQMFNFGAQDML